MKNQTKVYNSVFCTLYNRKDLLSSTLQIVKAYIDRSVSVSNHDESEVLSGVPGYRFFNPFRKLTYIIIMQEHYANTGDVKASRSCVRRNMVCISVRSVLIIRVKLAIHKARYS